MELRKCCAPAWRTSKIPTGAGSAKPSMLIRPTRKCSSPGRPSMNYEPPTKPMTQPRARRSRPKSSRSSPPAQSPRSPASDAPCGDGKTRSLPTSPPTGPTTAPQKRSTASSNSTDASPADSETARTTHYECSWPAGASPTTNSDEPPNYTAGFKKGLGNMDFAVAATAAAAIRHEIPEDELPNHPDPRSYAYGHDIAGLLLAKYANALKNKAGLRSQSAVEGALLMAVQAVGPYKSELLFKRIYQWLIDPNKEEESTCFRG